MSLFNETVFSPATGQRLNYAIGPAHGPPVVLFHGVLRGWRDFAPLLAELSLRHQLFALDFRGHGESTDDADASYRVLDYVKDAISFIRDVIPKPAVLYGHSLGAMVAAAVAADQPDLVTGLILEDPPFETMGSKIHQTPLGSYFRHVQQIVTEQQNVPPDELANALAEIPLEDRPGMTLGDVRDGVSLRFSAACLKQIDPRVLAPIVDAKWLDGYDVNLVASRIKAPTLILQADGASGGMLTDDDATMLRQTIADCTLIKLQETGHLIHWTRRELTLQHVTGFLEAVH